MLYAIGYGRGGGGVNSSWQNPVVSSATAINAALQVVHALTLGLHSYDGFTSSFHKLLAKCRPALNTLKLLSLGDGFEAHQELSNCFYR